MSTLNPINTLILTGGGMRDVSIIGALHVLEKKDILNSINRYAGSSSGALICVLLNIGYTPSEIQNTVFSQGSKMVYDNLLKIPFNLLLGYGLFSGNKMVKYIRDLFSKKGFNPDITFMDLYNKTQKTLVLTGTSLTQKNTFYFNYHTFPDMKVIDALRISISIPLYFTSIKYTIDNIKHIFVDGGLLNNFPIYYFEIFDKLGKYINNYNSLSETSNLINDNVDYFNTIGIMIINPGDLSKAPNPINNIKDFIVSLINTVMNKIQVDNLNNPDKSKLWLDRIISINLLNNVSPIDFDLSKESIDLLVKTGNKSAEDFFKDKNAQVNSIKNYINWF